VIWLGFIFFLVIYSRVTQETSFREREGLGAFNFIALGEAWMTYAEVCWGMLTNAYSTCSLVEPIYIYHRNTNAHRWDENGDFSSFASENPAYSSYKVDNKHALLLLGKCVCWGMLRYAEVCWRVLGGIVVHHQRYSFFTETNLHETLKRPV